MERESKYNYYVSSNNDNSYSNHFIYSKKNNFPTTVTEIVESREQNTLPISAIMPNIKEFYISFMDDDAQNNDNNDDLDEENKKVKIKKSDLYKIFKMTKIPKGEISPYILFSFTSVRSEIVTNTIKAYKIDYKKLVKLIQYFYIQFGNDEDRTIEMDKKSILKIFELLGLTPNEQLSFLQFFEVDEEIEYEEEEDDEDDELFDLPLSRSKKIKMNIVSTNVENNNYYNPNTTFEIEKRTRTTTTTYPEGDNERINHKIKNNKIRKENIVKTYEYENEVEIKKEKRSRPIKQEVKEINKEIKEEKNKKPLRSKKTLKNRARIKYIGGNNNEAEKLEPSPLYKLKTIVDNIPSYFKRLKNNKNKSNLRKKNLKKNKSKTKVHNRQTKKVEINEKVIYTQTKYERENIVESDNYYDNEYSSMINNPPPEKIILREEYSSKKSTSQKSRPQRQGNICKYAFILPKSPEYGNCTMYLTGSIPQIGKWNERQAIQMDEEIKNGQVFYTKYLDINKDDLPFEYKYFFIKDGAVTWLGKSNINYKAHPQYFHLYQTLHKNKISVFDLNIRYLNDVDGLNIWDFRKAKLIQVILKYSPDILFFQEITRPQYEYMEQNLNSIYENVGVYRDNTDHSEKCSISYNKVKYTLTDWGQFWLSSTPYIPGSNDFGNFFPRICTWALLRQVNGDQFLFFNIHLDHANFSAHLPCMNVVLNESEKVIRKFPDTRMIFLGGCFYCEEDDPLINKLKSSGYKEVMFENTFHDFTGEADRHWDYMFWRERNMERGDTKIELKRAIVPKGDSTIDLNRQQFISDHYPVIAEFEIETKTKGEDLILEDRNKKEFSEMDEEENDKKSEEFEEYENNDNEEENDDKDKEDKEEKEEKEEKDNEDKDSEDKNNNYKKNEDKEDDDKDDDDKDDDDKDNDNDNDDKDNDDKDNDNDEKVDKEKDEKANDKDNENDEENEEVEVIEVEEETEGNNDHDNEKDDKDNKSNKNKNDEKEDDGEEVEEIEEEIEVVEQDEDGEQEEQEEGE